MVDYKIEEYVDDDDVEDIPGFNRPNPEQDEGGLKTPKHGNEEVDEETAQNNDNSRWSRSTQKNYTTGQWPALGSLSYQWEDNEEEKHDEEYDSTEEEAMAYLRAVR